MLTPRRNYDCQSLAGPRGARHWSRHISCSILRRASSTDAAAELISSESMTKSLWKHFYLCVCLCGELRGPLAGLPLRLSRATDVQGRLNQFDLQEGCSCRKQTVSPRRRGGRGKCKRFAAVMKRKRQRTCRIWLPLHSQITKAQTALLAWAEIDILFLQNNISN